MITPTRTRPVTTAGGLTPFGEVAGHPIYIRRVRTYEGRVTSVHCGRGHYPHLAGEVLEPKNRDRSIEADVWTPGNRGAVPVACVDFGVYLIVDAWLKTTMTDPEYQAYLASCGPVSMWDQGDSGLALLIAASDGDE